MSWLVATALRFRVLVVALAFLLLVAGQRVLPHVALDVFPEFAPPLVEIQTEAPGLSSAEVETLVTIPIENAVNGTSWLTTVRSKSVLGLSSVQLIFQDGVDLMVARQLVNERLARITGVLPDVADPPVMLSPLSSLSRVMKIGLWSQTLSQMEMTEAAQWKIRPRLMAVPGVANVAIWGERDRELQVLVEPDRLQANGLTLNEVIEATRAASSLGGGGFLDTPQQRLAISQRPPLRDAEDLAAMPVAFRGGAALRLGDVADVVEGYPAPIGDAVINDVPGLLLIVEKEPWGNTLDVTQRVEAILEDLRPALAGIEVDTTIFRPATFVEMSLANLRTALLIGAVLVIAVLSLFLYEWRTALISVTALPLSLTAAALAIHFRGGAIDTMVLAGLIIALGEVVDDAIIDVENITRRLRLNRALPAPRPALRVVLEASLEVRSAVVYASLIIVIALVPVFLLEGLSGSFFRPLALSYILAILASLLVALTVTPALCLLLLPDRAQRAGDAPVVTWLTERYRRVLPAILDSRRRAALLLGGTLLAGVLALPLLGQEFLPRFREYDFLMHWVEKPGISLDAMRRVTTLASLELRSIPGVRNFGSHIGRAKVADEVVGPNFTELWISLDPEVDYEPTIAKVQEVVDGYPGLYRDLLTYLRERVKEVLTGTSATVVVRIFGPELEGLRDKAREVAAEIADIEGIRDLKVEQQVEVPQIEVRYRPADGARFGLTAGAVNRAAVTLTNGELVGEFLRDQMRFGVRVWGAPSVRSDLSAIRALPIDTPGGGTVPLGDVADVQVVPVPNTIKREAASRRIDVKLNVEGRDLGGVARDVEQRVRALPFARGYHPEFLGEYAEQQAASRRIALMSLLALGAIFLIIQADFGSFRLASLVLVCMPFALVGGVAAVVLTGAVLSLGSIVGFVTVLGIAVRNSLMLISHYRHLEREEGMAFGRDLIVRGAEERLAPILMTALTTILALLPIVIGGNQPGYEIEHPMAVVIVGGLITSTILNLLLMPALYGRWGKPAAEGTMGA